MYQYENRSIHVHANMSKSPVFTWKEPCIHMKRDAGKYSDTSPVSIWKPYMYVYTCERALYSCEKSPVYIWKETHEVYMWHEPCIYMKTAPYMYMYTCHPRNFFETGFRPLFPSFVSFVPLSRTKPAFWISTRKPILSEPAVFQEAFCAVKEPCIHVKRALYTYEKRRRNLHLTRALYQWENSSVHVWKSSALTWKEPCIHMKRTLYTNIKSPVYFFEKSPIIPL